MTALLLTLFIAAQQQLAILDERHDRRARDVARRRVAGGQSGQATAEYALVLLGVAAIALLLAAWAAKSGKVGQLFDAVVDQLIDKVK